MKTRNISIAGLIILAGVLALLLFPILPVKSGSVLESALPDSDVDSPASVAAVGPLFNYQGDLRNASGIPISNSSLSMSFRLFSTTTGGSACWTENRNVNVQNGQFSVILGQVIAIPASCVGGDTYLELVIGGETLSPRELLTSVATAVTAMRLPGGAEVGGSLLVADAVLATSSNKTLFLRNNQGSAGIAASESAHVFIDSDNNSTGEQFRVMTNNANLSSPMKRLFTVNESGDVIVHGINILLGGETDGHNALRFDISEKTLHLLPWGGGNYPLNRVCIGCGGGANLVINGHGQINGDLILRGSCLKSAYGLSDGSTIENEGCRLGSIVTGAVIEANLQTPTERDSDRIERFSEGDVLCWAGDQLEKCDQANDRLVQAVADVDGRPIIIGAENIRVLGPVIMGDILVSSHVPGHAMVNNEPLPGTVIGQALEDFDGGVGLIKAMIRKW